MMVCQALAQSLEYPVKANYLVRFAAFVQWPEEAFETAQTPFQLCVSGTDPFGADLDRAAQGQKAHNRDIVVRRLRPSAGPPACHMVYVGRGSPLNEANIRSLRSTPLLVVTDEANGRTQGAIHFVLSGSRVRFRVDQAQVPRGMAIDSRLLALALSVKGAS